MKTRKLLASASVLALVASGATSVASAQGGGEFDGVEVNIVTFDGPQIAEPLQRRAPDFNELTGRTDQCHNRAIRRPLPEHSHGPSDWHKQL